MGTTGQTVRACGGCPLPQVRTDTQLPPLDDYRSAGEARNLSWSSLRREILALLWKSRSPWGVYGIAARLSGSGSRLHPTSVYRSIRKLENSRLVIPIVSWSRYVISPDPRVGSWGVILCSKCRRFAVVPMPDEREGLWSVARGVGFRAERAAIECIGRCAACSMGEGG